MVLFYEKKKKGIKVKVCVAIAYAIFDFVTCLGAFDLTIAE